MSASANLARGPRRSDQRLGDGLSRRWWALDGPGLRAAAQRQTGLSHFGNPPLEPALSCLTQSLEAEAGLHPLGRFLMRTHLLDLLQTRLRLAAAWQTGALAGDGPAVEQPLFIIGMPRSGSTFLHELLAQDPQHRAPRVWEVMFPLAAPGEVPGRPQGRVRKAALCLWWFRRLARGADSVYPMRAHTPHECVAIHSYTLRSQEFVSTCRIPSYEAFLKQADLEPVYEWEKRFLQHLEPQPEGRRWVLKSPDHVHGLGALFAVFPDAWIIQTHRNPWEVLRSSAELTRVLHALYGRPGDPNQLQRREARLLAEGTERLLQFRDRHPELAERFIDVKYTELVAAPLAVTEAIYQRLGVSFRPEAAGRMALLAGQRTRYRRRRVHFATDWLKTELAAEASRFEHYCSRFDLPVGRAELGR